MNVPILAPFAYGASGRWLTSSQAHEVFICDGNEDHTVHVIALDGTVTGLRNTDGLVLALDDGGMLYGLDPGTGQRAWVVPVGSGARMLDATETGRWAVVHDGGVSWGEGPQQRGHLSIPEARFARFDPSGQVLAVVDAEGSFRTDALAGSPGPAQALGFAPTGLAHSRLGWWLVSTTRGIFRVPVSGGEPELYLKWGGGSPPEAVACSHNGRLCAFITEGNVVALFGVERDANLGAIVYADRKVGELEFGPQAWLGVGIGLGDGNKIDLLHAHACHRTDPPPDRPRNRWMLQLGYDPAEIAPVFGPPDAAPAPSADPRTQWGANEGTPATGDAPPSAGMHLYAVGLLGIAAFLAYTAVSDWYDDSFMAWLGVGILGVSGLSILLSGLRK
ncbi:MAG: hypothetical protein H6712_16890 [Myxococcales bacterium]|nr:hypothetical protein [Myxococcales bacterium]